MPALATGCDGERTGVAYTCKHIKTLVNEGSAREAEMRLTNEIKGIGAFERSV